MLDRTQAPSFQKNTQISLLAPREIKLGNGSVLHVLAGGSQEVVHVEIIAHAGKWYEPATGVSHFTALQLDKGITSANSFQIASFFDSLGAHIEITPGNDFITIGVYSLSRHLEEVLKRVVQLLTEPVFPQQELQLSKDIAIQNLRVNEEKTSYLAGKFFKKALFGEHPYGSELDESAIQQISREQVVRYHAQHLNRFSLVASGNLSPKLTDAVARILDQLPASSGNDTPGQFSTPSKQVQYYPREGSVQTTIRYGCRTISRSHPEFFDLLFATHVLGGYFGSRLMKNIREEKGLTYGIYATVHALVRDAFFVIGADVNRENRELTIQEINAELARLHHEPLGDDELMTARNHFVGSLQAEVTTVFAQGEKFKTRLLNQLPEDYYQKMIDRVEAITAADIQRTSTKWLSSEMFTEVSVG